MMKKTIYYNEKINTRVTQKVTKKKTKDINPKLCLQY